MKRCISFIYHCVRTTGTSHNSYNYVVLEIEFLFKMMLPNSIIIKKMDWLIILQSNRLTSGSQWRASKFRIFKVRIDSLRLNIIRLIEEEKKWWEIWAAKESLGVNWFIGKSGNQVTGDPNYLITHSTNSLHISVYFPNIFPIWCEKEAM